MAGWGKGGSMGVTSCPVKVCHKSVTSNNDFMFPGVLLSNFLVYHQFFFLKASFFYKKGKYDWFKVTVLFP